MGWWTVVYTNDWYPGGVFLKNEWAKTAQEAGHKVTNREQGRNLIRVEGPFDTAIEAESNRRISARNALRK